MTPYITGKYVYLHKYRCSDCDGQSAMLDSMMINVTELNTMCVQFWYYFHGATIASLKWSMISGDDVSDIWYLSGNQEEDWDLVQLNVSVIDDTIVRFKLEGVYGTDYESDTAIDDLSIYGGACVPGEYS